MITQTNKNALIHRVLENKGIIIKVCNSYCKLPSDREDLAQEIIYHLLKSGNLYNPAFSFSTWMYRIALNVAISFYRKGKTTITNNESIDQETDIPDKGEENDDEEEKILLLQQYIFELKDVDKVLMILYLEGKNYTEIASIAGITETNTATRISRIKEKLKQRFSTQKK